MFICKAMQRVLSVCYHRTLFSTFQMWIEEVNKTFSFLVSSIQCRRMSMDCVSILLLHNQEISLACAAEARSLLGDLEFENHQVNVNSTGKPIPGELTYFCVWIKFMQLACPVTYIMPPWLWQRSSCLQLVPASFVIGKVATWWRCFEQPYAVHPLLVIWNDV